MCSSFPGSEHKDAVAQHCNKVMDVQGKMREAFQVHTYSMYIRTYSTYIHSEHLYIQ